MAVVVTAIVLAYAGVYVWGMAAFEGQSKTFPQALQVVVEAITTAGFGGDAGWESAPMNFLIIAMNLTGVLLVFLALPVVLVPLLEGVLVTEAPDRTDGTDHVVVCGHTAIGETLRAEFDAADVPYLFVVPNRDRADELHREGWPVIVGDPTATETLENANLPAARTLIADVDDEINASVVLAAEEVAPAVRLVSVVENVESAEYHRYAGADEIVQPRRTLGRSLARKATTSLSDELEDAVAIGEDFEVTELRVHAGSDLAGRTIRESGLRERYGVTVIGTWTDGEFRPSPDPETPLDENTIVVVAGPHADLANLKARTVGTGREERRRIVVVGQGYVGRTAAETIREEGHEVVTVDRRDGEAVDVVGDARDRETYAEVGLDDVSTVVLTLDDDTASVYASLVLEDIAPDVEVIARANDEENVPKLYRAGSDYVLSLSTVTGRMLASALLDEEVLTPESQYELVRTEAPKLAGQRLGDADVRSRTGCTVVAAEREGRLLTDLGPDFVVQSGDVLVVAGDDAAMAKFTEIAGVSPRVNDVSSREDDASRRADDSSP